MKSKSFIRIVVAVLVILLVPLVAMQFTDEVHWGPGDFIVAGILLLGTGLTFELVAGRVDQFAYRAAVGLALAAALLLIWINLAVGIIGSEDNPANLLYAGVLAISLIGAGIARLQPRGMARAMFATALAIGLVPLMALLIWKSSITPAVWGVHGCFVALFGGSAWLFHRVARQTNDPGSGSAAQSVA